MLFGLYSNMFRPVFHARAAVGRMIRATPSAQGELVGGWLAPDPVSRTDTSPVLLVLGATLSPMTGLAARSALPQL